MRYGSCLLILVVSSLLGCGPAASENYYRAGDIDTTGKVKLTINQNASATGGNPAEGAGSNNTVNVGQNNGKK